MDTGPHKYHNKYHTVRTVPNSNETVAEMSKHAIPDTQIHERWVAWFATDTLMKKRGGVKLSFMYNITLFKYVILITVQTSVEFVFLDLWFFV
jgi:hypothetical protein